MPENKPKLKQQFAGVMVSSTFKDLEQHRTALMDALRKEDLFAIGMEDHIPLSSDDVIGSSLAMVRKSSAYIGLISHRYGQIIACEERNQSEHSVTRLEFEEAQRLGLPMLIFIMHDDHPVKKADIEMDPIKVEKLNDFRNVAKTGRIYREFENVSDFTSKAIHAIAKLREEIDAQNTPSSIQLPIATFVNLDPIPKPPTLYAEPPYIGSHQFVGRRAQLEMLDDWSMPADPHPLLLFEAIGGTGKSMLTWEWTTKHAHESQTEWAGIFWYSFYEKGAVMADFCRRALSYITNQPFEKFRKKKTLELTEQLVHHLKARPWLFILDGLERVLVAYHRIDAASILDEEVNNPTDKLVDRDPCAAIRPEDDDLLRMLASATPSKILVSTRLTPKILLNQANQSIPGVLRVALTGLRPSDAELLFRSCGITGDSKKIQEYLTTNCDCHPLVIGVLAGLVNNYLPDKGNFDAWVNNSLGGAGLNLAKLDLVQKRNHILKAGLEALPEKSRQLLSTLALLADSVDYEALSAFNPHLPPEPEEVDEPQKPEESRRWKQRSEAEKLKMQEDYEQNLINWKKYQATLSQRIESLAYRQAPAKLAKTMQDLEKRGLVQYDHQTKRYDLHPVVRGVASGELQREERNQYGQLVVDHFSSKSHTPYDEVETLEDIMDGLHIVRTLLKMEHYQKAMYFYRGAFSNALLFNLEANSEILSLVKPFFPNGWSVFPKRVSGNDASYLLTVVGINLDNLKRYKEALLAYSVGLKYDINQRKWFNIRTGLSNIAILFSNTNHLRKYEKYTNLALEIAELLESKEVLFVAQSLYFSVHINLGNWVEVEKTWQLLSPMEQSYSRARYRPGEAEYSYCLAQFQRGRLKEEDLKKAESLAISGRNRYTIRGLYYLRGVWSLNQNKWELAIESLQEAVRMGRAVGQQDEQAETYLALAKLKCGQLLDPITSAKELSQLRDPGYLALTELWLTIGDQKETEKYALLAYKWAWADGEPYVNRYSLNKVKAIMKQLDIAEPQLPPYDPTKEEKLPFEDDLVVAIAELRAEKAKKKDEDKS